MSKSRITLYDLMMRSRPQPPSGHRSVHTEPEDEPDSRWWDWLTPGRAIRLPIGYVLVIFAGIAFLSVAAYIIGHQRGDEKATAKLDGEVIDETRTALSEDRPEDPLAWTGGSGTLGTPEEQLGGGGPIGSESPTPAENRAANGADKGRVEGRRDARGWGPVESDPRQDGISYFVLAETTRDGALRLAAFCRDHGLETYVVGRHNTSLRRVVAFPGFLMSSRADGEVKALEAFIHSIGDQWKRAEPGATSLRDAYAREYRLP